VLLRGRERGRGEGSASLFRAQKINFDQFLQLTLVNVNFVA
jgi:hypothetical protein